MKKILLFVIFFITTNVIGEIFSGDFEVKNESTRHMYAKVELVSIPFEGFTDSAYCTGPYLNKNRVDDIQNGSLFKMREISNNILTFQMMYHRDSSYAPGTYLLDMGSCMTNEIFTASPPDSGWGFGIYRITINIQETGEKFWCYLNSLDSKYAKVMNGANYGADWCFVYYPVGDTGIVVVRNERSLTDIYDTLTKAKNGKMYKVWKVLKNRNEPYEENFKCRSTPFPISKQYANDTNVTRHMRIGTKIVMDTVWYNNGDKFSYNTDNNIYNLVVPAGLNDLNSRGNTYITPGGFKDYQIDPYPFPMTRVYGMVITADSGSQITLKKDKRIIVYGLAPASGPPQGDTLIISKYARLVREQNAEIFMYFGGVYIDSSITQDWSQNACMRATRSSAISFVAGQEQKVNNGGFIVIDSSAKLRVGNNTTLTFDGPASFLKLSPTSTVELGTNAKIVFKNGAKIDAQNVTFNCSSSWEGIVLEDAAAGSIIKNCTFNNAKTSIKLTNGSIGTANRSRIITGNTFNPSSAGRNCIYAENCYSMYVDNNIFNSSSSSQISLYIRNSSIDRPLEEPAGPEGTMPEEEAYSMLVSNNYFNGGMAGMVTANYTIVVPYYIYKNKFNNVGYGIVTRNNDGEVKENTFINNCTSNAAIIAQSDIDMFGNDFKSNGATVVVSVRSNVNASPLAATLTELNWASGNNKFTSSANDNILIVYSDFNTNNANNCFTKPSNKFHISGQVPYLSSQYNCINNYWGSPNVPGISLIDSHMVPVSTINYTPVSNACDAINFISYAVYDIGYGVLDTVRRSENFAGTELTPDEEKYNEAYNNRINSSYVDAINSYNDFIINYPESGFMTNAISDLYDCYLNLDTNLYDQDYRDSLYSTLKNFLTARISSGLYPGKMEDDMYYKILICEGMIHNYTSALDGYTFIAMYHSDPLTRLAASWDAAEVEDLMDNESGGANESDEKTFSRRIKQIEKLSNTDPLQRRLKEGYKKEMQSLYTAKEKTLPTEKLSDKKINEKASKLTIEKLGDNIYDSKQKEIINRSRRVLMTSRSMTNEQKSEEQLKDLMPDYGKQISSRDAGNELPASYSLSQNYPNPFNPWTNIKYSLPKAGFVSIKIYDVTGRMVKELVNEMKETGSYSVMFEGSKFASGVYFYRIETNNFVDTKRMVLIK